MHFSACTLDQSHVHLVTTQVVLIIEIETAEQKYPWILRADKPHMQQCDFLSFKSVLLYYKLLLSWDNKLRSEEYFTYKRKGKAIPDEDEKRSL
jgi:hypothetical protein